MVVSKGLRFVGLRAPRSPHRNLIIPALLYDLSNPLCVFETIVLVQI